jgi:hypothetical protein
MKGDREHLKDVPHYVYRYFAADGICLYIGCTHDLNARHKQHQDKEWFATATRREHTEYPDRWTGLVAEKTAIMVVKPVHNKTHNWWLDAPFAGELHRVISARPANSSELIADIEARAFEHNKDKQRVHDALLPFDQATYEYWRGIGVTHLSARRKARQPEHRCAS